MTSSKLMLLVPPTDLFELEKVILYDVFVCSSVMSFMKFNELKFICRSFQLDELDHLSVHCANELDHEFIVHFSVHFFIVYWNVVLHTRCIHVGPSHSMFYKGHQSKFRKNKDQGLVCVRKIRASNSKNQAVKDQAVFHLFFKAASFFQCFY